jgi:hypothetical protein
MELVQARRLFCDCADPGRWAQVGRLYRVPHRQGWQFALQGAAWMWSRLDLVAVLSVAPFDVHSATKDQASQQMTAWVSCSCS